MTLDNLDTLDTLITLDTLDTLYILDTIETMDTLDQTLIFWKIVRKANRRVKISPQKFYIKAQIWAIFSC